VQRATIHPGIKSIGPSARRGDRKEVLIVGQDNLFVDLPDCCVDHVCTGRSITPGMTPPAVSAGLANVGGKILRGRYDLIVLPAVDFRWSHDASCRKRWLRSVMSALARLAPVSAIFNRTLARRSTQIIVLDRYDSHEVLLDYLQCVKSARYCFKTNLLAEDSGRTVRFGKFPGCRLRFLPYWLATEKYSLPVAQHKDIDVFFAGDVNSPERQFSLAALRQLENEGFTIHFAPQRLAFTEYLAVMSRSWLTLSPQGLGYNGFRHYESMLVGSIPLINRPTPAIVHDFAHGRNSFLYSIESRDIQQVARAALRDKPQLSRIVAGLRQFVIENHSIEAVGRYVLDHCLFSASP